MKNKTIFEEPEDLNDFEEIPSESSMEREDKSDKKKQKKKIKNEIKENDEFIIPQEIQQENPKGIENEVFHEEQSNEGLISLEEEEILHQDTKKFDIQKELSDAKNERKSERKSEIEQEKVTWKEQKAEETKEKIKQEHSDIPKRKIKQKRQEDEFDFSEEKRKETKHPIVFGFLKLIFRLILYIVLVCGITYLVLHYVAQRTVVDGTSMESTLHNKDNLIIDKLTYRFEKPKRFDIIVFPYQTGKKVYYIKRIIGLPGETVRIDTQGNIYINEKELQESYGMEVMKDPGLAVNGITLGKDEYFVLGDNRNDSTDSRSEKVGLVKRSDIIGKAFFRVYPLQQISFLEKKE